MDSLWEFIGFLGGSLVKNLPAKYWRYRRHRFSPWVGKIPWRRKWQYPCLEKSHEQRSLVGCRVHKFAKESDRTEWKSTQHHHGNSLMWSVADISCRSFVHGSYILSLFCSEKPDYLTKWIYLEVNWAVLQLSTSYCLVHWYGGFLSSTVVLNSLSVASVSIIGLQEFSDTFRDPNIIESAVWHNF